MRLKRLVVMISGSGSNLQALLDAIARGEIDAEIVGVISSAPGAYGISRAEKAGIPAKVVARKMYKSAEAFNAANLSAIESFSPDGIVLAGYLAMISPDIITKYLNKIINIHPALIPSFCGKGFYGKKVHQGVLDYGAKISGATTHFVDEGADTGPVIMQKSVPVLDSDTAETLAARVLEVEHEILVKTVQAFCSEKISVNGRKVTLNGLK